MNSMPSDPKTLPSYSILAAIFMLLVLPHENSRAEAYLCKSKLIAEVGSAFSGSGEWDSSEVHIDTSKGFREIDTSADINPNNMFYPKYRGTCYIRESKFLYCDDFTTLGDSASVTTILVDKYWNTYVYNQSGVQHVADGQIITGECIPL